MDASTNWWEKDGHLSLRLTKRTPDGKPVKLQLTDKDVDWCSERVRFYLRQGSEVPCAIDRAITDFRALAG